MQNSNALGQVCEFRHRYRRHYLDLAQPGDHRDAITQP
jgi:hypothetical protein